MNRYDVVVKSHRGEPLMQSRNLAAIYCYARLQGLDLFEVREEDERGYRVTCYFKDGAHAVFYFRDWRNIVSKLARGSRRANGLFSADLAPTLTTPQYMQDYFYSLRDMHK